MGSIYRQAGRHVWQLKYYRHGRAIFESSGSTSYDEAKKLLATREAAIAAGALAARPGRLRVDAALADVIRDYRVNGKRSLGHAEARTTQHLVPWFGARRLATITAADVRAYTDDRLQQGAKPATVNRELALLKRACTLAQRAGTLVARPYIPMLQERNARQGFFEAANFAAVVARLPTPLAGAMTLAYWSGWRVRSEILTLEWRQVDLVHAIIRLEPETTKNREGREFRYAPIAPVVEALETAAAARDAAKRAGHIVPLVFHTGGGQPIGDFRVVWRDACAAAGVPGRIPHDLRRTAVRNLVRAGVSEKVAMRITGHKTRAVFDRYDIVAPADLDAAADKLAMGTAAGTARRGPMGAKRKHTTKRA